MPPECFRDPNHFPPLSKLPMAVQERTPPPAGVRRRCFVGEVTKLWTPNHYHTKLIARDLEGSEAEIGCSFPVDAAPGLDAIHLLQPGVTILILDACVDMLFSGEIGIEIRDASLLKILPFGTKSLVSLNNAVPEFTSVAGGIRCFGCHQRKAPELMNVCPQCEFVSFCNRSCQREGWSRGGHGFDCAILRDYDLQVMFHGDWNSLDRFASVYLNVPMPSRPIWV
ncbi:hypothetical protein BDW62DRAFT_197917 [Aspergillus aurantiobrunneus]